MSQPQHVHGSGTGSASHIAVGASFAFDPGKDGLASIYANRIVERGGDPRAITAQVRADRMGVTERGAVSRALIERPRTVRFGRGTAAHLQALAAQPTPAPAAPASTARRSWNPLRALVQPQVRWSRRLATAGLAVLLLSSALHGVTLAQESPGPTVASRYIVQPGDTPESIASIFDVPSDAILMANALVNPPYLTANEVVVIPGTGEDAELTRWSGAAEWAPYVVDAHVVAPGETLADIAAAYKLDPWVLAEFNGISDIDALDEGQRLRIPLTDSVTPEDASGTAPADTAVWTDLPETGEWTTTADTSAWAPTDASAGVGGGEEVSWEQPASTPVFAADVPAYMQAYSLSCEYAAAFIATSAFGNGVPESAFMESVPQSENPHWGYRGDISGPWGGTDDYGVYAEALVPTLQEWGFNTDVFYGTSAADLTARLDAGMPVITWLGYFGDTGWWQYDAGDYLLAPGMHVVTVYGYDDGGVYLSNPGRGAYDYYDWDTFMQRWGVINGMALAVSPI
jgi:uncharacterized protein YvpB/LysM repeat protein